MQHRRRWRRPNSRLKPRSNRRRNHYRAPDEPTPLPPLPAMAEPEVALDTVAPKEQKKEEEKKEDEAETLPNAAPPVVAASATTAPTASAARTALMVSWKRRLCVASSAQQTLSTRGPHEAGTRYCQGLVRGRPAGSHHVEHNRKEQRFECAGPRNSSIATACTAPADSALGRRWLAVCLFGTHSLRTEMICALRRERLAPLPIGGSSATDEKPNKF